MFNVQETHFLNVVGGILGPVTEEHGRPPNTTFAHNYYESSRDWEWKRGQPFPGGEGDVLGVIHAY